jgi:hypothetical protein
MLRAAGVAVVLSLIVAEGHGIADAVDDRIAELVRGDNFKLRLASALALAKSSEPRALVALAKALDDGSERSVRRVCVLGLARQLPLAPAPLRRELLVVLERVAAKDRDSRIRSSAAAAVRDVQLSLDREPSRPIAKRPPTPPPPTPPRSDAPKVFVNIDVATDQSTKMNAAGLARLTAQVKKSVARMGYATAWPGSLPTSDDLQSHQARAYLVVPTVRKLEVKRQSERMTEVACTVSIRVTPWMGIDGKELWEAERAASASGSAKAQTGGSEREVAGGMRDCVEAVADEIATRQVVPFLQRLVGS